MELRSAAINLGPKSSGWHCLWETQNKYIEVEARYTIGVSVCIPGGIVTCEAGSNNYGNLLYVVQGGDERFGSLVDFSRDIEVDCFRMLRGIPYSGAGDTHDSRRQGMRW